MLLVLSYLVQPAHRVATITLQGHVQGRDIAATIHALYSDPAWNAGFDVLWDGTWVQEILLEEEDLSTLARIHREQATAAARREIILVRRALDWRMANLYATLMRASKRHVSVCRSIEEARALLHAR